LDFTDIKQVRKTNNDTEVNLLLAQGWELLHIVNSGCQFFFLLIRRG